MNTREAAAYLGVAKQTLYNWTRKSRSQNGCLIFHGRAVRFRYLQTGEAGKGRILFQKQWLDELKRAMECDVPERKPAPLPTLSHIHVELGTPEG